VRRTRKAIGKPGALGPSPLEKRRMDFGGVKMNFERLHRLPMQWLLRVRGGVPRGVRGGGAIECGRAESGSPLGRFRTDRGAGRKTSPYLASAKLTPKAKLYYLTSWGVDKLKVSYTSSGNLIRFSYRVSDPKRAKALADKKATRICSGRRAGHCCRFPVMEKIGQLRQAATPQAGQSTGWCFPTRVS